MSDTAPAGRLTVVGLGPGDPAARTPEAAACLGRATDLVGYGPYLDMAGDAPGRRHPSDNREESSRARQALDLAAAGGDVALVSSGDPGVFAMAAAVMELLDAAAGAASSGRGAAGAGGNDGGGAGVGRDDGVGVAGAAVGAEDAGRWAGVEVAVLPGVTAAQAAAARAGAPLGHDFCVISLSDNLKPWPVVERRLAAAAAADFVVAIYNPASRHRPWQLGRAAEVLLAHRAPSTPVVLGRDVGRPGEEVRVVELGALATAPVDMRTVVLVGSSATRCFTGPDGRARVYTPRAYPGP